MHWIPPKERPVPQIFHRLVRLRPAQAWLLVLFCTDAVALADLLTGPDLWFGPVYLLVMCVAAWTLGWRAGQSVGMACMALTFAINGFSLYPYGDTNLIWNLGMRFTAVSIVIAVISGMRRAYVREWWLARTDILTGAFNRQAFFELAAAVDTTRWRLLVYADLDGLKKLNDIHGHAAGDACLQAYGSAVRKMIRRNDIFARIGGDEFVIFMSVKDEAAARGVAARLHKAMNSMPSERRNLPCSVGGLVVPPGEASVDDLVRSADNLMYEAKLRGACLQLGNASGVRRPAVGRARAASRRSNIDVLAGKKSTVDRRAYPQSLASEIVPR
jgi:diguanylate cyclase (GGDEF)-like protein